MLMQEALRLIGDKSPTYRVHFEARRKSKWVPDFFPGGSEEPFHSREEADARCAQFIERAKCNFRDIRVCQCLTPVRTSAASHVWAYCRVSLDKQDPECVGQRDAIEPWVKKNLIEALGCVWDGAYFIDAGVSSSIDFCSRPSGYVVNSRLKSGDHVVVAMADRAFGGPLDACRTIDRWQAAGIHFHALDLPIDLSQPMGMALMQMRAVIKQLERHFTSKRTSDNMKAKKRAGRAVNQQIPLGKHFNHTGKTRYFVTDPDELHLMRQLHYWRTTEGWSFGAICRTLAKAKIRRNGCYWQSQMVIRAVATYQAMLDASDPELAVLEHYPAVRAMIAP